MEISPLQNVEFSTPLNSTSEVSGANTDITFQYGDVNEVIDRQNTQKDVEQFLKSKKGNIELKEQWIGDDYILIKGDGETKYGQLRSYLGIPAGVLSETNDSLKDTQILKDVTKIYLNDIGWYRVYPQSEIEAADIKAQRRYGNHFAGYQRAITNGDIKEWLR